MSFRRRKKKEERFNKRERELNGWNLGEKIINKKKKKKAKGR